MGENPVYIRRRKRQWNRLITGGREKMSLSLAMDKKEIIPVDATKRPFLLPHHQTNIILTFILGVLLAILFLQMK